ncbi:MAG: hypothetical protein ABIG89_04100 [Candidatus Woesearchaeota archaeon]
MFNFFKSKGLTHLRSVFTDYELINQIYHKLKDLNNSEIEARKGLRDNNPHKIISELHKQIQIMGSIDYITKVKALRIGEINKSQAERIKNRIKQLKSNINSLVKEHKRHLSSVKSDEDKKHVEYLKKHHNARAQAHNQEIAKLKKLLEETDKIRNAIRRDSKKSIEDSQKIIYNV